jgi:hypothetical protein
MSPPAPNVEVVTVRGAFGPEDAAALREHLEARLAGGARWVAVDLSLAEAVDGPALAGAARLDGVVVCGGGDALLLELTRAGIIATRRLLDVRIAAPAGRGDGLKRRIELLALPRL